MTRKYQVTKVVILRKFAGKQKHGENIRGICVITGITERENLWNEHITRVYHTRLVKITRDIKPIRKRKLEDTGRDDVKVCKTIMVLGEKKTVKKNGR